MINAETIRGEAITFVLNELIQTRTLVRMKITGKDYEQLTLIHALRSRKGIRYFLIEHPVELQDVLIDYSGLPFQFEFTSPEGIPYSFNTLGDWMEDEEIWLRLPEMIERRQQRKNFRIEVPENTFLYFTHREEKFTLSLINVSLGGSLGLMLCKGVSPEHFQFEIGDIIEDLRLVFRNGPLTRQLNIRRAKVVRTEIDQNNLKMCLACEFLTIDKDNERKLTEIIFDLQRQLLRKRLRDL